MPQLPTKPASANDALASSPLAPTADNAKTGKSPLFKENLRQSPAAPETSEKTSAQTPQLSAGFAKGNSVSYYAVQALQTPQLSAGFAPPRDGEGDGSFHAAAAFDQSRPGFVFKKGERGLGYYRDTPPVSTFVVSAPSDASAAAAAGGGGTGGAGLGPMAPELKDGVKKHLPDGHYKRFVTVAKDLKTGKTTRDAANAEMKMLLHGRPDLITLFQLWSAPAGSGEVLATKVETIKAGSGARKVGTGDTVKVHVTGSLKASGAEFWSTKHDQKPFSYQVVRRVRARKSSESFTPCSTVRCVLFELSRFAHLPAVCVCVRARVCVDCRLGLAR
jgi:hypothetical protein